METKTVNSSTTPATIESLKPQRTEKSDRAKRTETANTDTSSSSSKSAGENFGVSVSPKARELAEARKKATEIARNTPDIREDRVAELKRRITSGEYKLDSGNIADGMAREAMRDDIALQMNEEAKSR